MRWHGGGARRRRGGTRRECGGGCAMVGGHEGVGADGCGEMTGLGFGGSGALKKKNSSDGH
jgi:hypothetical protein